MRMVRDQLPIELFDRGQRVGSFSIPHPDPRFYKADDCLDQALDYMIYLYEGQKFNNRPLPENWDTLQIFWGAGKFSINIVEAYSQCRRSQALQDLHLAV